MNTQKNGAVRKSAKSEAERWAAAFARCCENALDLYEVTELPGTFAVTSASNRGAVYLVTEESCGCKAFQQGYICQHRAAVRAALGTLPDPAAAPVPAVCAACHGKGTVLFGDERTWPYEIECPRCGGSGLAPACKPVTVQPVALAAD